MVETKRIITTDYLYDKEELASIIGVDGDIIHVDMDWQKKKVIVTVASNEEKEKDSA